MPLPPSLSPLVTASLFSVSVSLFLFSFTHLFYFLDSTCKWEHTVFVFLCLTYFIKYNLLQIQPCCCKWQNFILFHGWIIVHSVCVCMCVCVCVCVCVYVCVCVCVYIYIYIYIYMQKYVTFYSGVSLYKHAFFKYLSPYRHSYWIFSESDFWLIFTVHENQGTHFYTHNCISSCFQKLKGNSIQKLILLWDQPMETYFLF